MRTIDELDSLIKDLQNEREQVVKAETERLDKERESRKIALDELGKKYNEAIEKYCKDYKVPYMKETYIMADDERRDPKYWEEFISRFF